MILLSLSLKAQYTEKQDGIIFANGKKFEGLLAINLQGNTVLLDEGTQNRMFHNGIEKVVLSQQTYITATFEDDDALFCIAVEGKLPLLERFDFYFSYVDEELIQLGQDEKLFYSVFGKAKKSIKDYAFLRNISFEESDGIITIFEYYNNEYID